MSNLERVKKARGRPQPDLWAVLVYAQGIDEESCRWHLGALVAAETERDQLADMLYGHGQVGDLVLLGLNLCCGITHVDLHVMAAALHGEDWEPAIEPEDIRKCVLSAYSLWHRWANGLGELGLSDWAIDQLAWPAKTGGTP